MYIYIYVYMYILQIHEILNFLKPSSLGSKEDLRNPPSHLAETWGRTQTSPCFLVFAVFCCFVVVVVVVVVVLHGQDHSVIRGGVVLWLLIF